MAKSALSDEETLQPLATELGPTEALIVGKLTGGFPLLVCIGPLPAEFPSTGQTRSSRDAGDVEEPLQAVTARVVPPLVPGGRRAG